MRNDENKLFQDTRTLLDRRSGELDDTVVAKLRAARLRATEVAARRSHRGTWSRPVGHLVGDVQMWSRPVTGLVAASLVLVVAATVWYANPTAPRNNFDDLEMLASSESPEFYQDLDFYLWLDERKTRAG